MLVRIKNKGTARKLFRQGQVIHLFPCKVNIHSPWWDAVRISQEDGDTFDHLVNSFEYYNCNHETGYYAHYYVERNEEHEDQN